MFAELGEKIDDFLHYLNQWHLSRSYYELYMYLRLKAYIKKGLFKDDSHFNAVIIQAGYQQLRPMYFSKLVEKYYEGDTDRISSLKRKANNKWDRARKINTGR